MLFEDSAALAGLVIAALGVWLSHTLNDPRIDGVASILIGIVLGLVAILLARESKGLLIGERADPEVVETIRDIVAARPWITRVNHVRTIHTAPDSIFAAISADFVDSLPMGAAETMIEMLEDDLRLAVPSLSSIYIRPEKHENAGAASPQHGL